MIEKRLSVFISHSVKDNPFTSALYRELKQEVWLTPWLDTEDLRPGQDFAFEILKALYSANVALVCISNNALPMTGYFKSEVIKILELAKKRSDAEFQILILRLDDAQIPEEVAMYQSMNATGGVTGMLEVLRKRMENR